MAQSNGYEIKPKADLRGANLSGANLSEANLRGAKGAFICAGYDNRGYRFTGHLTDKAVYVLAGCRWFTIEQAVIHWTEKNNKDALARVALIQSLLT